MKKILILKWLAILAGVAWSTGPAARAADSAAGPEREQARQIHESTGIRSGVIVHLGCGDGKLTVALRTDDSCLVQGLDADPQSIEAARKNLQALGVADKVSVEPWTAKQLPYVDNLVNLIVVSGDSAIPKAELLRVLAPNGVVFYSNLQSAIGNPQSPASPIPHSALRTPNLIKPWPQEIDEWTHYLHGPDNNAVARDKVVGPPAGVQWVEGPLWQRHHEMNANPNAMVSAQGRLFYINDEAPATIAGLPDEWMLVARDAFNGVLLWKRPIADWGWKAWATVAEGGRFNLPLHAPRRMVASGDRVFVTLGFNAPLTALDAATGQTLKTYAGTESTDEILFQDGLLILSVNQSPQKPDGAGKGAQKKKKAKLADAPENPAAAATSAGVRKRLMVLKADTGEILWSHGDYAGVCASPIAGNLENITRLLAAVGGGKIVCVDHDALVGVDLMTGRELWRSTRPPLPAKANDPRENLRNFSTLVIHQDVALFQQTEESYATGTWNRGVHCLLTGLALDTGKTLWSVPCSKWGPASEGDVFVIHDLAWTHAPNELALIGVDLHSGQIKQKISTALAMNEVHHHRCVRNKATEDYIFTERRGIEAINLHQGQIVKNEWVRGACRYGIMPCNGLIYVPPHPCECYIDVKLSGFFALSPAIASRAPASEGRIADRLEKGPAFHEVRGERDEVRNSDGWATYRHDNRRSGATAASVPAGLTHLWEAQIGAHATACTMGGGRVFTAASDEHRVVALDAKDGHTLWSYTVGGRVDTPPTVYQDKVLFGSSDGWVYGLRAADGALAWRFRAAPTAQRIVALGQLESLWPVHGTVLVDGDVACVAAGRSTHLDGGIRVYALKADTGELIRSLQPLGANRDGLEDVLTSDGNLVFMRNLEFSLKEAGRAAAKPVGSASEANLRAYSTAGLLDDSCFARVGWKTQSEVNKRGKSGGGKPADLLVFDGHTTFTFGSKRSGGFGGWFQAGTGAYEVAALDNFTDQARWAARIPVRVRAMAAAGQTLVVAGPRDLVYPKDPWAAVEGRAGGVLCVLAAGTGKQLAEYPLSAPPIWDGLAVGNDRVLVSTIDGKVVCLGK